MIKILDSKNKNFDRILLLGCSGGLILPFLVIVILLAQTKFNLKISALALIFKILLVGDLAYILFNPK